MDIVPTPDVAPSHPTLPQVQADTAALFLDFDGTLVDIAPAPDQIDVAASLGLLLADLNRHFGGRVAIVSGRGLSDLIHYLPDFAGPMVGGHGAEMRIGSAVRDASPVDPLALSNVHHRFEAFAQSNAGVLYEPKASGAALHYRAAPDMQASAEHTARSVAADNPDFDLHRAKMAVELRPRHANKRRAVATLIEHFGPCIPIAIGDDATDEDMMALALERGGVAIKVGAGETVAPYRVPDPTAVHRLLTAWLKEA